MPPIPQERTILTLPGGPTGPTAGPEAFGGGRGMAALGAGLADIGSAVSEIAQKRQADQAMDFASSNVTQLVKKFGDFVSDENNNTRPDFDEAFEKFARQQMDLHAKASPNKMAQRIFNDRATGLFERFLLSSMQAAENNRIILRTQAIDQQGLDMASTYRSALKAYGPPDAAGILMDIYQGIQESIDQQFSASPKTRASLKASTAIQAGMALAEDNPQAALEIANSGVLDERQRVTLINAVEQSARNGSSLRVLKMQSAIQAHTANADNQDREMPDISLDEFIVAYGDTDQAASAKFRYDETRLIRNMGNGFYLGAKGTNPVFQQEIIGRMDRLVESDPSNNAAVQAVEYAKIKLANFNKLALDDAVAGQMQANPYVQAAAKRVLPGVLNDSELRAATEELYRTRKRFQGAPDENATPEELPYFLSLPTAEQHLLTQAEAKEYVRKMKNNPFNQAVLHIHQFRSQFFGSGSDELDAKRFSEALNDLVTLGDLPQSWRLAFLHHDSPELEFLVQAIANSKTNFKDAGIDGFTKIKWDQELAVNPEWQRFERAMRAEGQRGEELEGYANGLLAFAAALPVGLDPKAAVDAAVSRLLSTKLAFIEANRNIIMIARWRNNEMGGRGPEEIKEIEIGINRLMNQFGGNIRENSRLFELLSQTRTVDPLTGSQLFPEAITLFQSKESKAQFIADIIADGGFLRTDFDGQGATLWAMTRAGFPFELRDHNDRPFRIQWDVYAEEQLPDLRAITRPGLVAPGVAQEMIKVRRFLWINQEPVGRTPDGKLFDLDGLKPIGVPIEIPAMDKLGVPDNLRNPQPFGPNTGNRHRQLQAPDNQLEQLPGKLLR